MCHPHNPQSIIGGSRRADGCWRVSGATRPNFGDNHLRRLICNLQWLGGTKASIPCRTAWGGAAS